MKNKFDITNKEFLKMALMDAQVKCPVNDDTFLQNFEDFCQENFFDINDATELLTEFNIMKDKMLKPPHDLFEAGLFETVWLREEINSKEVFRSKIFITERGECYLFLVLFNLDCLTTHQSYSSTVDRHTLSVICSNLNT